MTLHSATAGFQILSNKTPDPTDTIFPVALVELF